MYKKFKYFCSFFCFALILFLTNYAYYGILTKRVQTIVNTDCDQHLTSVEKIQPL